MKDAFGVVREDISKAVSDGLRMIRSAPKVSATMHPRKSSALLQRKYTIPKKGRKPMSRGLRDSMNKEWPGLFGPGRLTSAVNNTNGQPTKWAKGKPADWV